MARTVNGGGPPSPGAALAAAWFFPIVLALVVPADVVLRNLDEVPFAWKTVALFLALFFTAGALSVWAWRRAPERPWARRLAVGLVIWGVWILGWDLLGAWGSVRGLALEFFAPLELALTVALAWVIRRMPPALAARVFSVVGAVLLGVSLIQIAQAAWKEESSPDGAPPRTANAGRDPARPAAAAAAALPGNVYHIILDQYQSQALDWALERQPELKRYPLTFYRAFHSNSRSTRYSNAILLWGDYYRGEGSIEEWIDSAPERGLFGVLGTHDVPVHLYPFQRSYCPSGAAACRVGDAFAPEMVSSTGIAADLWFQRIIPGALRRALGRDRSFVETWDYGVSITRLLTGRDPRAGLRESGIVSLRQFERLLEDEAARPPRGQYVFAHLMLPHQPLLVDAQCRRRGDAALADEERAVEGRKSRLDALQTERYLEQVRCANRIVMRLLDRLRKLGRLEDALVLVHADHGRFYEPRDAGALEPYLPSANGEVPPFDSSDTYSDRWHPLNVALRSAALLLVKLPGQKQWRESKRPLQALDLVPTVLAHFGIGTEGYPGEAIQSAPQGRDPGGLFFLRSGGRTGYPSRLYEYRRDKEGWRYAGEITVQE